MKNTKIKCIINLAFILISLLLGGCKFFDQLVEDVMDSGGLSPRNEYTITTVDLMVVDNSPLAIESKLANQLRQSVNDGINSAQKTNKGKNLRVGVPILDKKAKSEFYKLVMTENSVSPEARSEFLRTTSDKLGSNMIIWGVYSGDDKEVRVVCFLYRLDLNIFSVSDVLTYSDDLPQRRKDELISKTVSNLIDKSLPEIGVPDSRKISQEVKKAAAVAGPALLTVILKELFSSENSTSK